jgi:hypothetical protein
MYGRQLKSEGGDLDQYGLPVGALAGRILYGMVLVGSNFTELNAPSFAT